MSENLASVHLRSQAVADAFLLIAHAARQGVDVTPEILSEIVKARASEESGSWTEAGEAAFWAAVARLAKLVRPVTVESLRAAQLRPQRVGAARLLNYFLPGLSFARSAVFRYGALAVLALILLLSVQIYWVIGSRIVKEIDTTVGKDLKELTAEREKTSATLRMMSKDPAKDERIREINNKLVNLDNQLQTRQTVLESWNRYWRYVVGAATPGQGDDEASSARKFQRALLEARFALDVLQGYLLPLLYGMLGACAFILRTLFVEIRTIAFTNEFSLYWLRVVLGILAGVAVGWFIVPGPEENVFKALSPMALAFLAGYSVELFFAAMDRLLAAFTAAPGPAAGSASKS